MRSIFIKILIYLIFLVGIHFWAAKSANGKTDPFYFRFTNGKQSSLILGSSRAAQGMVPAVFNETLNSDISNFAFTNAQSPYGEVYFEAIKKKLSKENRENTYFILEVNPWTLSSLSQNDDPLEFRERDRMLDLVKSVDNQKPTNLEYLLKSYPDAWGKIPLTNLRESNTLLHESGWLEITIPMDSISVQKRTSSKIKEYQGIQQSYFPSTNRLGVLENIITYLSERGEVYLVRLPIEKALLNIEKNQYLNFNESICSVAQNCQIPFWDFSDRNESYQFTDGNHLYKESSSAISEVIAEHIQEGQDSDCVCQ